MDQDVARIAHSGIVVKFVSERLDIIEGGDVKVIL